MDRLLHELQVHHIELEMQNEELRSTELELAASRDRYRTLLAAAPLGYVALDDRGRIREVSPPGARLLGPTEAELLGRHVQSFLQPVDADALHLHMRACLSTGTAQVFDVSIKGNDAVGRRLRLQMVSASDLPAGAKPECWVFMTDISERVETRSERPIVHGEIAADLEQQVVLLVDDEPLLLKAMERFLMAAGYQVIAVGKGAEALAVAMREGQRLDVLITDVRMPGMTGAELGERMATLRPDLPRLYVSGYVGDVRLEEGAVLLNKPYHPQTLVDIVAKRLSRQ